MLPKSPDLICIAHPDLAASYGKHDGVHDTVDDAGLCGARLTENQGVSLA